MDATTQVKEFLTSRRGRITPEQAGLPVFSGNRRVTGLRREEVALLAGVSVDYYVRLERGNLGGVSDTVLESLSRALQLDEVEHAHLFDLAHTQNAAPTARRRRLTNRVRPNVQRMLDAMSAPAFVRNGRSDFLAGNRLGRALYSPLFIDPIGTPNTARFAFLDPRARTFYPDWDQLASDLVAVLRTEAGRSPYDKGLTDLIGELSTRSDDFRVRWATHDVRAHRSGLKRIHHPVVGDLELTYEALDLNADTGLTFVVYGTVPDSASEQALELLAAWAATADAEERSAALVIDQGPSADMVRRFE
ncbi:transcriptional regulator [Curtobacterium sp. MCBD17_034]|uniref:helix-turn-helix transcriptional regulator n=1 Tax=unclassified Curtobacterium TaxID=257496 RepID=UPI000DA7A3B8|nr:MULTISPECIES: helix-turn-helix transcriptional regulator [unclassified Curtobacterium]PZF60791.1 transcriptional regulator [Curtobacterium sp. MCBD17_034]PZM40140.1 transcriptional regulator [Curtobacterium sp. MCBD17_031]